MQSKWLWKCTSSQGANRSWLCEAGPDFCPKILQSPERLQLHPHSNRALVLRGRWGPSL